MTTTSQQPLPAITRADAVKVAAMANHCGLLADIELSMAALKLFLNSKFLQAQQLLLVK
jgi:hypothetical protein